MKIIDLLNKIAKGIQPKKIKYNEIEFEWSPVGMFGGNYYRDVFGEFDSLGHYTNLSSLSILNEEIEVIEE